MIIKRNLLQSPKYIQWLEVGLYKDHGVMNVITTARVQKKKKKKAPKNQRRPTTTYALSRAFY